MVGLIAALLFVFAPLLRTEQDPQSATAAEAAPQESQGPPSPPESPPSPPSPASNGWRPVSGVSLIVNEQCITPRDIQRTAQRLGIPVSTSEERAQLFHRVASDLTRALLEEQAGKDLGFDPKLVERLVKDELERNVERAGSVSRLAERLQLEDLDSFTYRQDATARIYRQLWEGSVDGTYPGPGGRPYADRYVRPGLLVLEHLREEQSARPAGEVVLQQLVVDPRRVRRELDGARQLASELRARVEAGEDMGELAETYMAAEPGTKGISKPLPVQDLVSLFPELEGFLESALAEELSEVLPLKVGGEVRAYYFVKLLERHGREAADALDPTHQHALSARISGRLSDLRKENELRRLLEAAYVWPPEAFGRDKNP